MAVAPWKLWLVSVLLGRIGVLSEGNRIVGEAAFLASTGPPFNIVCATYLSHSWSECACGGSRDSPSRSARSASPQDSCDICHSPTCTLHMSIDSILTPSISHTLFLTTVLLATMLGPSHFSYLYQAFSFYIL